MRPLELLQRNPEVDHRAHGLQMVDRALPANHTAAGCNNMVVTLDRANCPLLRIQKIGYASPVQNILKQGSFLLLNDQIGI